MDLARWVIGKTYPQSVYSTGGRYAEKGVFESPDTQVAVFQFDDLVLTFELTLYTPYMIKSDQALRDSDMYPYWPQNARADRNLWKPGTDDVGSAWLRLAGLRSPEGPQAGDRGASKTARFPTTSISTISSSRSAAGSGLTRISKRATAAR